MARRKQTPERSILTRQHVVAYARKQGGSDPGDGGGNQDEAKELAEVDAAALATMKIPTQAEAPPDRPTMPLDPASPFSGAGAEPETVRGDVFGAPPELPTAAAGMVIKGGAVEDPTHMPGPRDIPPGEPDDVASPPGHVPKGDSRSLRRRGDKYEFALVYRRGNAVISRVGIVGGRGVWRVVEYPTTASASNAYAREASRFVTEGFSDYRE